MAGNSKYELVRHLALNLAHALARKNTPSKSMIKANRKDNSLLNFLFLENHSGGGPDSCSGGSRTLLSSSSFLSRLECMASWSLYFWISACCRMISFRVP